MHFNRKGTADGGLLEEAKGAIKVLLETFDLPPEQVAVEVKIRTMGPAGAAGWAVKVAEQSTRQGFKSEPTLNDALEATGEEKGKALDAERKKAGK